MVAAEQLAPPTKGCWTRSSIKLCLLQKVRKVLEFYVSLL
jgi:hypothetical protein